MLENDVLRVVLGNQTHMQHATPLTQTPCPILLIFHIVY